jgi:hypothetical protein
VVGVYFKFSPFQLLIITFAETGFSYTAAKLIAAIHPSSIQSRLCYKLKFSLLPSSRTPIPPHQYGNNSSWSVVLALIEYPALSDLYESISGPTPPEDPAALHFFQFFVIFLWL